ncbi:DEAD/DEAH box helicase [Aspergillus thermomutatus]|uniref:SNF2 N-terminal domain-containing protein n=1 Tax=Aspergillus thermomutatus TaxID=41047 RepID=A0A397G3J7_ASPTH|nr:uncharacterized protein CDV56_102585 [Aspergillus thermomutatus]RHZ45591.1 hypothetical protein CDV56_102585 [Aspergillus thermomutatus]
MNNIEFFGRIASTAVKRQVAADGDTDSSESKRARIEDRHGIQNWNGWHLNGTTSYGESTILDDAPFEGNTPTLIPDHLSVTSGLLAGSEMAMLHSGQPQTVESSAGSIQPVTSDLILASEWQGLDSRDLGNTWNMSFPTLWGLGRLYDSEVTSVDISGDNTQSRAQLDGLEQVSDFTSATPVPYPLSRMDLDQSAILDSSTEFLDGKSSVTMTTACTTPGLESPRLPQHNIDYDGSHSIIQENNTSVEHCLDKDDNDLNVHGPETAQCDTCFGEVGAARHPAVIHANAWKIVGTAASTFKGEGGKKSAGVNIKPFGNVLKLSFRDSGKYAGIVSMAVLVTLFEQHTIKLVGTLFAPDDLKGKNSGPGVVVRMILYGRGDEKEAVGACLSEAGVYLQHPRITEYDHLMPYVNPQFLIRPGGQMPKLEDLVLSDDEEHPQSSESLTKGEKSEIMRIFDSANTVNGPYQARSSPRLASPLKEHQIVALSMMVEREAGSLNDLKFPSLWERVKGTKVPRYRHKITGNVEVAPSPLHGGILADEMGLGKTLSLLALVCRSLDRFDEEQLPSGSPRATLIITPKSSKASNLPYLYNEQILTGKAIPGWEEQIKTNVNTPDPSSDEFPTSSSVASTPLTPSDICLCPSAKVNALLKNLEREQRADRGTPLRPVKSVIFSQWTRMLDLVAQFLRQHDYKYARIDGHSSLADRRSAIQQSKRTK